MFARGVPGSIEGGVKRKYFPLAVERVRVLAPMPRMSVTRPISRSPDFTQVWEAGYMGNSIVDTINLIVVVRQNFKTPCFEPFERRTARGSG